MNKRNNGVKSGQRCPSCGSRMSRVDSLQSCKYCNSVYELLEGNDGDWVLVPVSAQSFEFDELMDGYEVEEV